MSNQERRLLRRLGIGAGVGTAGPYNQPVDPRANLIQETDWQRNRLAEQVLLEMVGYVTWTDVKGAVSGAETDAVCLAKAALAAAEVIYPELSSGGEITEQTGVRVFGNLHQPPPAAQQGAESVGSWPAEPARQQPEDRPRGEG